MKKLIKVLLLIMDGFGHRTVGDDNPILRAHTPHLDYLTRRYSFGTIHASESYVGLPEGQFGNSEVGHLNIGAGRIVEQGINHIDKDIRSGLFASNPVICCALNKAQQQPLHILGLLSDGGVHSHDTHIHTLIRSAQRAGVKDIHIHAFLDGRDTPPKSAKQYLQRLNNVLSECPNARLASICGRYWAMDRDLRWERVESAAQLIVNGNAKFTAETGQAGVDAAYQRGETDEFIKPTCIGKPTIIADGDVAIFMNFRADRARQLTSVLIDPSFASFPIRRPSFSYFATLTLYSEPPSVPVAYKTQKIRNGLGEYLSNYGLKQLRIAETEKYPHVTYFFNGGEEKAYPGEDRILIPSPTVATYDLQPQMSAFDITNHIVKAVHDKYYDIIICNYANADMVGHTGNFDATVKAVEALDQCLGRCAQAVSLTGGELLLTADHGNCEVMYDPDQQQAHTQHTCNVVPFLYVGRKAMIRSGGALQDVAPSLLAMMGIAPPAEMTGTSLIEFQ